MQYVLKIAQPRQLVIICLEQDDMTPEPGRRPGIDLLQIGFFLIKVRSDVHSSCLICETSRRALLLSLYLCHFTCVQVEENRAYRLHSMVEVAAQSDYLQQRSVTKRLELVRGVYHVIPSTFAPDLTGNFMLRVISPQPFAQFSCVHCSTQ